MKDIIKEMINMKKYYYILIFSIIAVLGVFSSPIGAKLDSLSSIVQVVVMLAFVVPICLLLYLIGRDERIKKGFRIFAKIGTIFLIICYIGGALAELL